MAVCVPSCCCERAGGSCGRVGYRHFIRLRCRRRLAAHAVSHHVGRNCTISGGGDQPAVLSCLCARCALVAQQKRVDRTAPGSLVHRGGHPVGFCRFAAGSAHGYRLAAACIRCIPAVCRHQGVFCETKMKPYGPSYASIPKAIGFRDFLCPAKNYRMVTLRLQSCYYACIL